MEFIELFVGLFGCICGVIWYYMGLYLYKSGGKYGKMGVFCRFLAAFLCGSGWSFGSFLITVKFPAWRL